MQFAIDFWKKQDIIIAYRPTEERITAGTPPQRPGPVEMQSCFFLWARRPAKYNSYSERSLITMVFFFANLREMTEDEVIVATALNEL